MYRQASTSFSKNQVQNLYFWQKGVKIIKKWLFEKKSIEYEKKC